MKTSNISLNYININKAQPNPIKINKLIYKLTN